MKIAIIGLGLIGGSIGLGLKNSAGAKELRIIGIPRREETIQEAIKRGAIDEGTTDHVKGSAQADIIFICTPLHLVVPVILEITPGLKRGAIVTDVGSSKYAIVSQAEKIIPEGIYFVGGHPMAGKETTKLEAAQAQLFKHKTWILTKTSKTDPKTLRVVSELVSLLGAKVEEMPPKTHDLVVAAISHLPLLLAATIVNMVANEPQKDLMAKCAAGGFRDMTRIALGDPILGVDLFTTNKQAVLKMVGAFKTTFSKLEKLVKEGNGEKVREELEKAKNFRGALL